MTTFARPCLLTLPALVLLGACATDDPLGSAQQPSQEEIRSAIAATEAIEAAAEIAEVFADLPESAGGDGAVPSREDEVVEPTAADRCVTIGWDRAEPLRLTLTLDACVLPSGEILDGEAAGFIELAPRFAVGLAFTDLTRGEERIDGELLLYLEDGVLGADVDLAYLDADTDVRLVLDDARLTFEPGSVTLDGSGSFTEDGETSTIDVDSVVWDEPGCRVPSGGRVVLEEPDSLPLTLTFARDVEGDPIVLVAVGPWPAVPVELSCD